jgi:biopolymer transport protein ExbB
MRREDGVWRCGRNRVKDLMTRWIVAVGLMWGYTANLHAQIAPRGGGSMPSPTSASAGEQQHAASGFFDIVFSGGPIGITIMLMLIGLSIAMVALAVEHLLTIRREALIPPELEESVAKQLSAGNVTAAVEATKQRPSLLGFVLHAGLSEIEGGWTAVEKAMEDATAEQAARLLRKIEYFSVIGNLAPMMGLLGTVVGMVFAFREVADTQGAARAAELASGIYQALVTTVAGLLIAIPSLAMFAVFRNRVDQFVAEAAYAAQHAMRPIKRMRVRRAAAPTTSP